MDLVIGILLLITYFLLIFYAARGGNLMIGFLGMGGVDSPMYCRRTVLGRCYAQHLQGGPESGCNSC